METKEIGRENFPLCTVGSRFRLSSVDKRDNDSRRIYRLQHDDTSAWADLEGLGELSWGVTTIYGQYHSESVKNPAMSCTYTGGNRRVINLFLNIELFKRVYLVEPGDPTLGEVVVFQPNGAFSHGPINKAATQLQEYEFGQGLVDLLALENGQKRKMIRLLGLIVKLWGVSFTIKMLCVESGRISIEIKDFPWMVQDSDHFIKIFSETWNDFSMMNNDQIRDRFSGWDERRRKAELLDVAGCKTK